MVARLSDLMEDATDFSWQGAKAKVAHALLCEMDHRSVTLENEDQIDRILRAHAQIHVPIGKHTMGRADGRKPWFYKTF